MINTKLNFKGRVSNINDIDNSNYSNGDVVIDKFTGTMQMKYDQEWVPITTTTAAPLKYDPKYDTLANCYEKPTPVEIKKRICDCCGAPLKIRSKYDTIVTCEYCDTVYTI